ncbi:YlxR family protein [Mariniluteicoccus flavus]
MTQPIRTCVGCRSARPQAELVRVAVVAGVVDLDPDRTAAGRGAWLHPDPDCVALAVRRRAFGRALRTQAPVADGLAERVAAYAKSRDNR